MTREELIDRAEKLRRSISCGQTFKDLLEFVKNDAGLVDALSRAEESRDYWRECAEDLEDELESLRDNS